MNKGLGGERKKLGDLVDICCKLDTAFTGSRNTCVSACPIEQPNGFCFLFVSTLSLSLGTELVLTILLPRLRLTP